jgi:hypothetical protein
MMYAMPARENETVSTEPEVAPEPAPVAAEQQQFSTEGDLPAVAQGGAAAGGVTASEMAFDNKQPQKEFPELDKGMHHWEHYKATCEAAGKPEKWQDYYRNGHTEAAGWLQPYEHKAVNDFQLKKGHSASEALQKFIHGPTICDYRVALLAGELDELRDEMGDRKFDHLFGAKDAQDANIPAHQRLRISSDLYTTPLTDQMKAIAAETEAREQMRNDEPAPAPVVEARVEEKPAEVAQKDQDPVVVAQELGVEQRDREIV